MLLAGGRTEPRGGGASAPRRAPAAPAPLPRPRTRSLGPGSAPPASDPLPQPRPRPRPRLRSPDPPRGEAACRAAPAALRVPLLQTLSCQPGTTKTCSELFGIMSSISLVVSLIQLPKASTENKN